VLSAQQKKFMSGEKVHRRWAESQERVDRIRDSLNGRPFGHPQDYEDVLGPERSGGMKAVTSGPKLAGLLKDEGWGTGTSGVPAKPNGGNGNGLSGGAARQIPTGVSF
jgi:hypothetical protein